MMSLDISKQFPSLSHAPIVEAVIEMRSNTERQIDEKATLTLIKARLPEYPNVETQRGFSHSFSVAPNQPPHQEYADLGFKGFRLLTADKKQITVFGKENYTFSRISPYENWEQFSVEALRLWDLYKAMTDSSAINRLGVRFINKIALPQGDVQFDDYLKSPPSAPDGLNLAFVGFFHQDTMAIPDHKYVINFIRTIQPSPDGILNIILDIDVFIEKQIPDNIENLMKHLEEMRFIKNSVFFNSITNKTLEMLK